MKHFISRLLLLGTVAFVGQACAGEKPDPACESVLTSSQQELGLKLEVLAGALADYLSQKNRSELMMKTDENASIVAEGMRSIFINQRGVRYDAGGYPQPMTGGAGFATLKASGQHKNLMGIYQANTKAAVCGMPYAPNEPKPIDPDNEASALVANVSSITMRVACWFLPRCSTMESSIFLNVSNKKLAGDKLKRFYDDGHYQDQQVFKTFGGWAPGGNEQGSWPQLGFQAYEEGEMDGDYVIFEQKEIGEYLLLFYKPFLDNRGEFGGTAYAFTYLYDEFLANEAFQTAVEEGVCPLQSSKCLIP